MTPGATRNARFGLRAVGVVVAALALALGSASAASAHVKVIAQSTLPGAETTLTFTVPVESATANTIGLTVQLPKTSPFTSVLAEPVPGWTARLTHTRLATPLTDDDGNTISEAVTQITWTATDGGLAPGQFGEFPISVGPLPKSGTLYLPAEQKYSDGFTVDWVQQAQGGAEPAHPAPSVVIASGAGTRESASDVDVAASAPAAAATSTAVDGWAIGFGVAGVVIALSASGVAAAALRRTRR